MVEAAPGDGVGFSRICHQTRAIQAQGSAPPVGLRYDSHDCSGYWRRHQRYRDSKVAKRQANTPGTGTG